MGTTKVRLNDRRFMERMYNALSREEEHNAKKNQFEREKAELERVKKLVIEGEMEPPEELLFLNEHPVFRYKYLCM